MLFTRQAKNGIDLLKGGMVPIIFVEKYLPAYMNYGCLIPLFNGPHNFLPVVLRGP